jgi:SAM-dependent methyltransferase/uncharacterized protein YbaR (Trm112 family)
VRPAVLDLLQCPLSGGPFTLDVLDEGADGAVEHGVLTSEAGEFPVVAGIPVLRPDVGELVDLVRSGDHDRAVRRAAFGEIEPAGLHRAGGWLSATDRLRPLGRRILERHRRDLDRRSARLTDPTTSVRDLFELAYTDLHLRNPEVFAYNWYRFGIPRDVAALAAIEWTPQRGPVLDVGCGAGHLTWALTRHLGPDVPVVGVDGLFFALYVARTRIAPDADYVCGELESLPLRDGTMGGIWASDVFHAVRRKAQVARELARVSTADAWGAVVAMAVAGHAHEYRGRPLSVDGYRRLLPTDTVIVTERDLVAGYLERRAASRRGPTTDGPTVAALWDGTGEAVDGAPFETWPHGRGELGPNPLLAADGRSGDGTRVRLRFPTASFEREHGALRDHTPATAVVPDVVVADARAGRRTPEVEALVDDFVLVGTPPGYDADRWAGFGPGA